MDWTDIEKNWKHYQLLAQRTWPQLTHAELEAAAGQRTRLVDKVRDRLRLPHEEAEWEVNTWAWFVGIQEGN